MIYADRARVPEPTVLRRGANSIADEEFKKAETYYRNFEANRQEGSFNFKAYRHPEVKAALDKLFHGKCAYCESSLRAVSPGDIEMFRPKGGVIGVSGAYLPIHYWWLANSWSNLYLSCIDCNRVRRHPGLDASSGKGGRFPLVDESGRAPVLAGPDAIAREQPLLLDPCEPGVERFLIFDENGMVASSDRRGQTTIEILGLNREYLVEERRTTAVRLSVMIDGVLRLIELDPSDETGGIKKLMRQIRAMTAAEAPYAGMCRQLFAASIDHQERLLPVAAIQATNLSGPSISAVERRAAEADLAEFQKEQADYSLEGLRPADVEKYLARDRRIEGVSIRNMRAIKLLKFDVADRADKAPWLMLLGENATGKSTVLQSIALALIGDLYLKELRESEQVQLADMVGDEGDFGEVEIRLGGVPEPRRMRIDRAGNPSFTGHGAQVLLLAYGSTRLLPRRDAAARYGAGYARIENLFDPFIPLADAERWLMNETDDRFDYAVRALKKLIGIPRTRRFDRSLGYVALWERGVPVPLRRLCDGYQTVIALFVDILDVVMEIWPTPALAQGIVLIDEVGNHLHPSWKLRFVAGMREFLPRVQVIATTHEPLCLRGLHDGEINVLKRRSRGGIYKVADLPSVEGLRVDQLLTSEHFGLDSTLDPALQKKFDEYHRLLRSRSQTEKTRARLQQLQGEVNAMQGLGNSERERLLLQAIDRFLADRSLAETPAQRRGLTEALDAELRAMWRKAGPG